MEHFHADLARYRLSLLMPALLESPPLKGTLRLERAGLKREFLIADGSLVAASSTDPREHLAQVLADLRILDTERAAAAYEAAEGSGQALGTFLVERHFLDQPRLIEALEHKAREAFFDCYTWESGEVEFTPWDVQRVRGVELKLKLGPLHRDAMARLREWRAFRDVFPSWDATFRVFPEYAADWSSDEDEAMIALATAGASVAELVASAREGSLFGARRLLHLYRRGVLSPQQTAGEKLGKAAGVDELLGEAREALEARDFQRACAVAGQALERAAIPEAQALYREAELQLGLAISDEVLSLEDRIGFAPMPRPSPPNLTADDLYLYSRLRRARSIRTALRTAAMGELAAYRSIQRLIRCGLVHARPAGPNARRKTDPFGAQAY